MNRITDIAYLLKVHQKSKGTTIDSRPDSQPGGLKGKMFFALKGERADGNDFAIAALKAGAIAAVIDNPKILETAQKSQSTKKFVQQLCLVEDVLKTLQDMGHIHRGQFKIPVIGITGTNGKTTTKELLAAALAKKFSVVATIGNLNTEMGVPMTLLRITDKTGIAVIEMGAKKQGDIRALCEIADPTHGLVTNMGIAHIEGFGSKENIVKTKSELYEYVNENGGTIFINKKDPILQKALQRIIGKKSKGKSAKIIEYGEKNIISEHARNKNLIGDYNLINMNAAKAIARSFKVSAKLIDTAISSYVPENMRSQHIISKKTGNSILLDAYNANPSSMPLAIDAFLDILKNGDTPYLILGEMRELGKESAKEHGKIMKLVENLAKKKKAEVVLLGDEFFKLKTKNAQPSVHIFKTKEDFLKSNVCADLSKAKRREDIFIKGSRGLKLEELVPYL
jgi:UDP-N-acetylmuramoyl-tripeptide--D-alanyl-D-alanine ligase